MISFLISLHFALKVIAAPEYQLWVEDYTTCVDSSGYVDCASPQDEYFTNCINTCITQTTNCDAQCQATCRTACAGSTATHLESCVAAFCWNQAYGCVYQNNAAMIMFEQLENAAPFFPAPQGVGGGCTCDVARLSDILNPWLSIKSAGTLCPLDTTTAYAQCACCLDSGILSAITSACPDSESGLIWAYAQAMIYVRNDIPTCANVDLATCEGSYGSAYPSHTFTSYRPVVSATATTGLWTTTGTFPTDLSGQSTTITYGAGDVAMITFAKSAGGGGGGGGNGAAATLSGSSVSSSGAVAGNPNGGGAASASASGNAQKGAGVEAIAVSAWIVFLGFGGAILGIHL